MLSLSKTLKLAILTFAWSLILIILALRAAVDMQLTLLVLALMVVIIFSTAGQKHVRQTNILQSFTKLPRSGVLENWESKQSQLRSTSPITLTSETDSKVEFLN